MFKFERHLLIISPQKVFFLNRETTKISTKMFIYFCGQNAHNILAGQVISAEVYMLSIVMI